MNGSFHLPPFQDHWFGLLRGDKKNKNNNNKKKKNYRLPDPKSVGK